MAVTVKVLEEPKIKLALLALVITGGALTNRVAVAVPPTPPSVELTAPVRLTNEPPLGLVTSKLMVQLLRREWCRR